MKFFEEARIQVEEYYPKECITDIGNGYMIVEVDYPDEDWVFSLLLNYGAYVEILRPDWARKKIKEIAEKIVAYYKHDIQLSKMNDRIK